ncbi:POK18 protein, partial [Urocynchramus pylzowi]|nr:POK18 protein [Urocynchramus pylzowi]
MPTETAKVPNIFARAKLLHAFYHQNMPALMRMLKLARNQARAIVAMCPNCQTYQIPLWVLGLTPGASTVARYGKLMLHTF